MSDKSHTLTLTASGVKGCEPDHNPWRPPKGSRVKIINDSGFEQTLTHISKGLLNPSPHDSVVIPANGEWSGTVGQQDGSYQYEDGLKAMGVRDGTIDPS